MAVQGETRVIYRLGEPETAAARFARQLLPEVPGLLEAFEMWIAAGGSGSDAAIRLGCHRRHGPQLPGYSRS